MFVTPISNNSTSHIKYPQTSFLSARVATIKKAQLVDTSNGKTIGNALIYFAADADEITQELKIKPAKIYELE